MVCGGKFAELSHAFQKCETCGFLTTKVDLSREDIEKLYDSRYFTGKAYRDYPGEKQIIQRNFHLRLKQLLRCLGSTSESSLFEIGCAYGFFLEVAQTHFKSVSGIDISADAADYGRNTLKLNTTACDYLDYEIKELADVICMWDTIEHLKNPDMVLEKASQHLVKNGKLAFTTGDIGSLNAKVRGLKWRQIKPPEHLHYFSGKTMERLLNKHGFRIIHFSHCGQYMSLDTVASIMFVIRSSRQQMYRFLQKTGILRLNPYVNMLDLMYIIAEKR
jgi:cyclopropane fatty-acyl-phospholipid synthase-like methyltransferase